MPDRILIGNITELGNGVRVNLIRSDSVPAAETFLSGPELEKLASFKIEKRRHDWLGGRYAAKTLLKESLGLETPLSTIEISYDPFGRPAWISAGTRRLLSITHSGPFCAAACAAAGTVFLGIDLEKAEPRAGAWYEDYFHKSELASPVAGGIEDLRTRNNPPATSHEPRATIRWTQKEALLKALGLGLKADLLDINLASGRPEFSRTALKRYQELGAPPFSMNTFAIERDWHLSIVCATPLPEKC